MRLVAALSLAVLAACPADSGGTPPPTDILYWPTGLAHVAGADGGEGVLFVANANFDKRYESGNLLAIDLDAARQKGLPAFGADAGVVQVPDLGVKPEAVVRVPSFTGKLEVLALGGGSYRLFVPSRSEGMQLTAVNATVNGSDIQLSCATEPGSDPRECFSKAPSLVANERSETGLPRAPSPFGVAVRLRACTTDGECGGGATCQAGACRTTGGEPRADVWVSHMSEADAPYLSGRDYQSFLVHVTSDNVVADDSAFIALGAGASYEVVAGQRWTYVSGRGSGSALQLVRLVKPDGTVFLPGTEATYRVFDARGLALSADEQHLYVAGRSPDALVSMRIEGAGGDAPDLKVINGVSLPDQPTSVRTIARPGRSDLVVVVCTAAGVLVLYDDDAGAVVAQVPGLGLQPFDVVVDRRGAGARLYVSNFGDGRIAVVDIRDLSRPHEARVVAHLGEAQRCLGSTASDPMCSGGTQ